MSRHQDASPDFDHLIFGPIDLDDHPHWPLDIDVKPFSLDYASLYTSFNSPLDDHPSLDLATWINDPDLNAPSSPIPISPSDTSSSYNPYSADFSDQSAFSPASFAALHPLPRSISPSALDDPRSIRPRVHSVVSPRDMSSLNPPSWASQLWDPLSPAMNPSNISSTSPHRTHNLVTRPSVRHSPLTDPTTLRQRVPIRRASLSSGQLFQSSSAPSMLSDTIPAMATRSYSRRADSTANSIPPTDDPADATVRRKKRSLPGDEDPPSTSKSSDGRKSISSARYLESNFPTALKSVLRPPKLAPSAWQLYFTDWIQKQQASGTRKLNVAQAAKEAGQEYACLSPSQKEPYKRRSQTMKQLREKEHEAYMRTLTPEDIKRENLFRAAQRKAGKSRKSNIKDPNAPKKPLSAYFMFLQRIRANPRLVAEIFADETETTKQSVLAAAKWRSMTDAERQPFLAQAEQEKMEYEAARRLYEEGSSTGFGSSINFSILPGGGLASAVEFHFPSLVKAESESESEGFTTDDGSESRGAVVVDGDGMAGVQGTAAHFNAKNTSRS